MTDPNEMTADELERLLDEGWTIRSLGPLSVSEGREENGTMVWHTRQTIELLAPDKFRIWYARILG